MATATKDTHPTYLYSFIDFLGRDNDVLHALNGLLRTKAEEFHRGAVSSSLTPPPTPAMAAPLMSLASVRPSLAPKPARVRAARAPRTEKSDGDKPKCSGVAGSGKNQRPCRVDVSKKGDYCRFHKSQEGSSSTPQASSSRAFVGEEIGPSFVSFVDTIEDTVLTADEKALLEKEALEAENSDEFSDTEEEDTPLLKEKESEDSDSEDSDTEDEDLEQGGPNLCPLLIEEVDEELGNPHEEEAQLEAIQRKMEAKRKRKMKSKRVPPPPPSKKQNIIKSVSLSAVSQEEGFDAEL